MREAEYRKYLEARDIAAKTREQRFYALKRLERHYGVDLDAEYTRDGFSDLLASLSFSTADSRAGRPNPSRLNIEQNKLLTHLAWYKSHVNDYLRFCGGHIESSLVEEEAESEELIEAASQTFGLEKDLQTALRQHITQLENGLTVADEGSERRVEAGFIDIFARDGDGLPVVIELKAGTSKPEAVAQLLAYMGCVAEETGQAVRGILIAAEHHPRVVLAARAVPNLVLKTYAYRFEFS